VRAAALSMAEVDAKKVDFLLLREVVVSLVTEDENFIHRVRNAGPKHPFLDKMPEEGPASVDAVDRFANFLVPFIAQFAATGFPHHSAFKASMACFVLLCSNLRVCVFMLQLCLSVLCACERACCFCSMGGGRCRQSWCMLPRPMLSFQKAHV